VPGCINQPTQIVRCGPDGTITTQIGTHPEQLQGWQRSFNLKGCSDQSGLVKPPLAEITQILHEYYPMPPAGSICCTGG
jgi:hypothetical protein